MIIRLPDNYFFQFSDDMDRMFKGYFRNSGSESIMVQNEGEDDIYSFKFADEEYVKEATE